MPEENLLKVRFAGAVGKSPDEHKISRSDAAYELDDFLWKAALALQEKGVNVIGALSKPAEKKPPSGDPAENSERSDLNIHIIPTGEIYNIFLPDKCARIGCRLDRKPFEKVVETVTSLIEKIKDPGNTVLLLNRFGKEEVGGGGYSALFEKALERDIPVIIGISNSHSRKNGSNYREAWQTYIEGTTGVSLDTSIESLMKWCRENGLLPSSSQAAAGGNRPPNLTP